MTKTYQSKLLQNQRSQLKRMKSLRKSKREWLKSGMKLIQEKEVKRTKTYLRTLMINFKIRVLLNKQ